MRRPILRSLLIPFFLLPFYENIIPALQPETTTHAVPQLGSRIAPLKCGNGMAGWVDFEGGIFS